MPGSLESRLTISMQPSKSVSTDSTSALLAIGWISCGTEILSRGRITTAGIPATAQYAASAAEVSPVEAQATALMDEPSEIICRTVETSTVIPRSLNDPVWLLPHILTQRSESPSCSPYRSAQKRL